MLVDGERWIERTDKPERLVRAYFCTLEHAHSGRRRLPDYVPSWLLEPFGETALHTHVLPLGGCAAGGVAGSAGQSYVWHPLAAKGLTGSEGARIYVTCVNRMQRLHELSVVEWLPERVRRALVHMLDQHQLLTLHMEATGDYEDAKLHARHTFGGAMRECLRPPTSSLYEELMPRHEAAFDWGALPDFVMQIATRVPLWGEYHDAVTADPVLDRFITYALKSFPIPFRKRELAKIVSEDVVAYPSIYHIMLRLLVATLLGAYEHARARPGFEARRAIYRRFALATMSPTELSAWLLRNKNTTRYVLMEYLFFAIESVPALSRLYRQRYNWETLATSVYEACDFLRHTVTAAVEGDQRDWLLRASRVRINRQDKQDPLALALRDACVRELYTLYSGALLWRASAKQLNDIFAGRSTQPLTQADTDVVGLLKKLAELDLFRRLAFLFRQSTGVAVATGVAAAAANDYGGAPASQLGLTIDPERPAVSVQRWLEMASAVAGAEAYTAGRAQAAEDAQLQAVLVGGVVALFSDWSFGVEERLEQHHKGMLKNSFRPIEEDFVKRTMTIFRRLDDLFYVNALYRERPRAAATAAGGGDAAITFTLAQEEEMRAAIFKFAQHERLQFDWLVVYGVSMASIRSLRAAQRLFCSETLRAQIGITLEAMLLTRYHDYFVLKRFFHWRLLHMSVAFYDLPVEMTREQLRRCHELRRSTTLEPTLGSYYYCLHCKSFKALYTGNPADLYPVRSGARRKRCKPATTTAAKAATAAAPTLSGLSEAARKLVRERQAADRDDDDTQQQPAPKAARRRLVDVSNRTIDPRHRSAIGSVETFYNPADNQVYCKNMHSDTEQRIAAYRLEADQRLERYAQANHITTQEAVRWITILKPAARKRAAAAAAATAAAKRASEEAAATGGGSGGDGGGGGGGSMVSFQSMAVAQPPPQTHYVAPESQQGTGQRRSVSVARKRRGLMPVALDAAANGSAAAAAAVILRDLDPQHFKRISKRERQLRETELCGYVPLPQINLIGRLFFFFDRLFFRCPRCVKPSIATYHPLKLEGKYGLCCTFCDDSTSMLTAANGDEWPTSVGGSGGAAPKRRFACHICGDVDVKRLHTAQTLTQHLVLDDDAAPPRLQVHQFCKAHSKLAFSSAGQVLRLSLIRRALDAGWYSRRDATTGVRSFVGGGSAP